jgi:hypothetical protein
MQRWNSFSALFTDSELGHFAPLYSDGTFADWPAETAQDAADRIYNGHHDDCEKQPMYSPIPVHPSSPFTGYTPVASNTED